MTDKIPTPRHLKSKTKEWFRSVIDGYDLEPHHVRILTLAAETWDRGQAAREVIDDNGMTYVDRFGAPKPRPEISIENECKITFARLVRELNLDVEPPGAMGRPPGF
jgi:hypothetical protein